MLLYGVIAPKKLIHVKLTKMKRLEIESVKKLPKQVSDQIFDTNLSSYDTKTNSETKNLEILRFLSLFNQKSVSSLLLLLL